MARLKCAEWRPLAQNATAARIDPRLAIVHTQVGYLRGTERWFGNPAADGVEATLGIGGPWDGADLDGKIWQWMDTRRQADCNLSANGISVSIEMSDGGKPTRPFSPKQVRALVTVLVELCLVEDIPPTLARAWNGSGLGYHQLFTPQWDRNHDCPGTVRRTQLLNDVFPAVAAALKPTTDTTEGGFLMALTDKDQIETRDRVASLWRQVNGEGTDDKRPLVTRIDALEAKLDRLLSKLEA